MRCIGKYTIPNMRCVATTWRLEHPTTAGVEVVNLVLMQIVSWRKPALRRLACVRFGVISASLPPVRVRVIISVTNSTSTLSRVGGEGLGH
jgi:hypothetical protein